MRTYGEEKQTKIILKKVTCDKCQKDCTNINVELFIRYEHCGDKEHWKDLCLQCFGVMK